MFLGNIWWNQIPDSIKFFESLKAELSADMNVIYVSKTPLPWWTTLYGKVKADMGEITSTRTLEHIRHENGCVPGKIIMDRFCSDEIQAGYWPGQSYAEYLASLEVTTLNNRIIWVDNITDAADAGLWIDFIKSYNKNRCANAAKTQQALFILGCNGNLSLDVNNDFIVTCKAPNDTFDRYMFCAMNTSEAHCSYYLKQYIAELAFNLGGDNPELCGELAIRGEELISQPHEIYRDVFSNLGIQTSEYKRTEISDSCIRIAQMKILFPVLEEKRLELIRKYRKSLLSLLPVQNSLDDIVCIPENLELGTLYHLYREQNLQMDTADAEALLKYREIRNQIAHNEIVPPYSMRFMLG